MSTPPSWEIIFGRCGSCTQFRKDFGGTTGKVYGHCPVKTRTGSISTLDARCDAYEPIAAVAPERKPEPARPRPKVDPFEVTVESPREPERRPAPSRPAVVIVRTPTRAERDAEPVTLGDTEMDRATLRTLIREAIEDSMGIGEAEMVDRFRGGTIVVQPGTPGAQARTLPIDALFHKIVMVRDNLRVLEQKINGHEKLDDSDRVQLQQYITRCYGSLTTFNMLFKNREDWFKGSSTEG